MGVYQGWVYEGCLRRFGLKFFDLGLDLAAEAHEVIYDIKSRPLPALRQARARLEKVILELKRRKVQRVVLGCTELPLALTEYDFAGVQLIDPTTILARALISQARPEKLSVAPT